MAAFTIHLPRGSSSSVVPMLKRVCMLAIWAAGLSGVRLWMKPTREAPMRGVTRHRVVKTAVPMRLNIRWMMVVRLALRPVPTEASTAVMQVPMFWPKRTKTALSSPMTPLLARAWRIPTEAEEDWMRAVKRAPARMPSTGLENLVIRSTKAGISRRGTMAALIMSMPMKRTPRPPTMLP